MSEQDSVSTIKLIDKEHDPGTVGIADAAGNQIGFLVTQNDREHFVVKRPGPGQPPLMSWPFLGAANGKRKKLANVFQLAAGQVNQGLVQLATASIGQHFGYFELTLANGGQPTGTMTLRTWQLKKANTVVARIEFFHEQGPNGIVFVERASFLDSEFPTAIGQELQSIAIANPPALQGNPNDIVNSTWQGALIQLA